MASAFGGQRSIQLSYGRRAGLDSRRPLLAEFGPKGNKLGRPTPSHNRCGDRIVQIGTRMRRAAVVAMPVDREWRPYRALSTAKAVDSKGLQKTEIWT